MGRSADPYPLPPTPGNLLGRYPCRTFLLRRKAQSVPEKAFLLFKKPSSSTLHVGNLMFCLVARLGFDKASLFGKVSSARCIPKTSAPREKNSFFSCLAGLADLISMSKNLAIPAYAPGTHRSLWMMLPGITRWVAYYAPWTNIRRS